MKGECASDEFFDPTRSVTNASMATTFDAFTRATISHCNGVCRSDCELTVGSL